MHWKRKVRAAVSAIALACAFPAAAQLNLPQLPNPLPAIPVLQTPARLASPLDAVLNRRDLLDLRKLKIRDLLQQHRRSIELDPAGEPIVRNRLVVLAPSAPALEAARAEGFAIERERVLEGIGERVVVLQTPPGIGTVSALERLRLLDPKGEYDFDHIYLAAGWTRSGVAIAQAGDPRPTGAAVRGPTPVTKIGLVDGGVDLRHPALLASDIRIHGCAGELVPDAHGTGVASLLVGRAAGFSGAAPGAALYAADVYCGLPAGGAATALVEALAWMAREQVPVINISLVGPANRTLERVIRTLISRGHLVVAAVGNEGPAAPPLYPAAYPGVIGVTAVDSDRRALPEAARGPHVAFAAPGADLAVAATGERGYTTARGTSFAAPIVAGLLATSANRGASAMEPAAAQIAVRALIARAIDLGPPGRDDIYGFGLLGDDLRVDPRTLR